MKLRFPIYLKIIGWFFLNLLGLALLALLFVRAQFGLGLDSFLLGAAGERIQAVSEVLQGELATQPVENWTAVLERFGKSYHVDFLVVQLDGNRLAGPNLPLPRDVERRLQEVRVPFLNFGRRVRPFDRPGSGPFPGEPGRPGQMDANAPGPVPQDVLPEPFPREEGRRPGFTNRNDNPGFAPERPDGGFGGQRREGGRFQEGFFRERGTNAQPLPFGEPPFVPRRGPGGPPTPGRFMVKTENPTAYWIATGMPMGELMSRVRQPVLLLIHTRSISGGLFFDLTPWLVYAACAIVISVIFWLPLVRNLTHAIAELTRATERIADGQFDITVDTRRNDELGRLGGAINRMASRLTGFVNGQKRFLGDTAHELCSPIARMNLALGILEERVNDPCKPYVDDVREEAAEMSALVNELLSFSKASLASGKIKLQPVCLAEVAAAAIRRESVAGVEIRNLVPPALTAQANPELLQRALANLIRNGIRYAGQAGPITIAATENHQETVLEVSDQGPGVPEESLPKLFDPFYRVDTSRTRDTGGVGLGLTIVKTCVEACGGGVTCHNRQPAGLAVRISLLKKTAEAK